MNNQRRSIGTGKRGGKSASAKNATQNKPRGPKLETYETHYKPQEPQPETYEKQNKTTRTELVLLGNPTKSFDLDVMRAWKRKLGRGTIGKTYKADLEDGMTTVVVKTLEDVVLSAEDFRGKVEAVGAMDHENLLPLRGYSYSKDQKFLLYEYMPLGSLSALLHGYRGCLGTPLTWEVRLSIALGAARAIEYLHAQYIHHGNIKSSNVLLTPSYEARVSEYGLPLFMPAPVGGDDPTMKDVYGFGALLLELLTGKQPTQAFLNEEGRPAWVQSIVRMGWSAKVFAVEILRYNDIEDLLALLQVAISCVSSNLEKRPRMSEVRRKIEELCGPGGQRDGDSQPNKDSKGAEDTSSWLISGAQVDRDSQLNQFREVNNDMYTRKPPDGVLEVSERVYGTPPTSPSLSDSPVHSSLEGSFGSFELATKSPYTSPSTELDQQYGTTVEGNSHSFSLSDLTGTPPLSIVNSPQDSCIPPPPPLPSVARVEQMMPYAITMRDIVERPKFQALNQQSFSSSEMLQVVISGEITESVRWEGIAAVTETNIKVTSVSDSASSSAINNDSVLAAAAAGVSNSAHFPDMMLPKQEKLCQQDGSPSSTSMSSGYDYDVFLSFRGPDTRSGITNVLYTRLLGARIHTFKDDEECNIPDFDPILGFIKRAICQCACSRISPEN